MERDVDIPRLEDYISLPEAAALLGISKQATHKLAYNKRLKTLRKIGTARTLYVVKESEIREMAAGRYERAVDTEPVAI